MINSVNEIKMDKFRCNKFGIEYTYTFLCHSFTYAYKLF